MVLVVLIGVGAVGWMKQTYLREQFDWYSEMYPYVLTAEQERELKAGQQFRECARICPEMVVIPSGRFTMGSDRGDERPQHPVDIRQPFAVSRFEVTFDQWDACVDAGGCSSRGADNDWGRGDRPKINVSWQEAKRYLAWLSKLTRRPYRLLSESEWEYLAKNQETTLFEQSDRQKYFRELSEHA